MRTFAAIAGLTFAGILAVSAQDATSLRRQGDAFDAQLKTREALERYLAAEKLEPNDSDLLHRIAKQYAELMPEAEGKAGQRELGEKAVAYARRSVEANPRSADAHLALAICYGRLAPLLDNRTKIAYSKLVKQHAEKALELNPRSDYALHVLGAWNYELAQLNALTRTLANMIYGALPSASLEQAAACFKQAVEIAPQRVSHHIELGRTYVALDQKDLARAELEKGLSLPSREKDDEATKARGREALKKL